MNSSSNTCHKERTCRMKKTKLIVLFLALALVISGCYIFVAKVKNEKNIFVIFSPNVTINSNNDSESDDETSNENDVLKSHNHPSLILPLVICGASPLVICRNSLQNAIENIFTDYLESLLKTFIKKFKNTNDDKKHK